MSYLNNSVMIFLKSNGDSIITNPKIMSTYIGSIIGKEQRMIDIMDTIGDSDKTKSERDNSIFLSKLYNGNIAVLVRNPFDRFVSSVIQVYINNGFGELIVDSIDHQRGGSWNDEFDLDADYFKYIVNQTQSVDGLSNQEYTKLYDCLHKYFQKYLLKPIPNFEVGEDLHLAPHHVPAHIFVQNMIDKGISKEKFTVYDVTEKNVWFESFLTDSDIVLRKSDKPETNKTPSQLKKIMKDILKDLVVSKKCETWIPIQQFLSLETLAYDTLLDKFKTK